MSADPLPRSPLDLLEAIAREEVVINDDLRHLEIYTMRGLLTILWHGPTDAEHVVLMAGGGMGGLLGPAGGLYHDLGTRFTADGIATMRVVSQGQRSRPVRARRCRGRGSRVTGGWSAVRDRRAFVRRRGRGTGRDGPRSALRRRAHPFHAIGRL